MGKVILNLDSLLLSPQKDEVHSNTDLIRHLSDSCHDQFGGELTSFESWQVTEGRTKGA